MNIHRKIIRIIFIAVILCSAGCSGKTERLKKITIKGSTTVLPISIKLSEKYMHIGNVAFAISATGSSDGIRMLLDGQCDLAASSRALSGIEINAARKKGMDIDEVPIAYDMISVVVNPANPVDNLSINQLKEIYTGKIMDWKEIRGRVAKRILAVSRDSSSGTYGIWNKLVASEEVEMRNVIRVPSNSAVIYAVSSTPGSIGYVGYGYLNKMVKPVKINNIAPSLENGISGRYPLSRKLYYIIDKNRVMPHIQDYIDYVLSNEGQKAVKDAGFLPL